MERGSGRVGEGPGGSLRVWEVIFIARTWTSQGVSGSVQEGLGGSERVWEGLFMKITSEGYGKTWVGQGAGQRIREDLGGSGS